MYSRVRVWCTLECVLSGCGGTLEYVQWRRPGAEFGGDGKIFRGPRFLNDVLFPEKISIFTPKISDDLFLVIDEVFHIVRFFTLLNVIYDPFFTRKTAISEKNSLIRPFF